ncbi:hypothetical protein NSZ01_02920 [Nocardioides szechwanensis]|nr:hypothetical protein [Nocardioides szechwanensis]GEP32524.1 hypothetical protein NSZ01_02920 [Nocardioides szechwanensis]
MDAGFRRTRLPVLCVLIASVVVACSTEDPETPPPAASSTGTPTPSDGGSAPTTPTAPPDGRDLDVDELVMPAAVPTMPAAWREKFVIGYGPGMKLLGTAPGGDSGSLDIGPEYGAPGLDGTWWFLDAAKARIAHYDAAGHYLDQVRISRKLLVSGRYFQWQLPHVLADGTLVAARQTPQGTALLRLRDGVLDEIAVDGSFFPTYDDGQRLYGLSLRGKLVAVDPSDGSRQAVRAFRTPSGLPFSLKLGDQVRIEVAVTSRVLPLRTSFGAPAHVGVQVRAGADGTLHLYLIGSGEDDESVQLVGATQVSPDGKVAGVEALANPFSEADPGSPGQLVIAPGSSNPMLVYVLTDGVHVYERSG